MSFKWVSAFDPVVSYQSYPRSNTHSPEDDIEHAFADRSGYNAVFSWWRERSTALAISSSLWPYYGLRPNPCQSYFSFADVSSYSRDKPSQSYIGLIAEAILSSPEQKLILSDIYGYILASYPYFRTKGTGWRNSIRHNLSLNDCFVKAGRSPNGKGHFWAIDAMYFDDFRRGDFRRRRTCKRKSSKRCVGEVSKLKMPSAEKELTEDRRLKDTELFVEASSSDKDEMGRRDDNRSAEFMVKDTQVSKGNGESESHIDFKNNQDDEVVCPLMEGKSQRKKKSFDMESILAREDDDEQTHLRSPEYMDDIRENLYRVTSPICTAEPFCCNHCFGSLAYENSFTDNT